METKTTKIIIGLENVVTLPCRDQKSDDENQWVFVEFPYKHLLPKVEAAWLNY